MKSPKVRKWPTAVISRVEILCHSSLLSRRNVRRRRFAAYAPPPKYKNPQLPQPFPGRDSGATFNLLFVTILPELPTSELAPKPEIHIWGRCSVRQDGKLVHADRAGHPSVSSFFNTDDTKLEYNASEPVNDRKRWLDQFVHLMGHTGNYSREEAIAAIDKERTLPDVLSFDPSKPAKYPNGRVFTDDVIDYRLAFLTKGECPPSGLKPHTDILKEFPYIGTPHQK